MGDMFKSHCKDTYHNYSEILEQIFRQRGFTATPTVAGSEISQEVQLVAQQAGCAVVLGGRYEFDLPFGG